MNPVPWASYSNIAFDTPKCDEIKYCDGKYQLRAKKIEFFTNTNENGINVDDMIKENEELKKTVADLEDRVEMICSWLNLKDADMPENTNGATNHT